MMTSINNEQRRDVLVRLGWSPVAVRRLGPEELAQALNRAWAERPLRVEFEALRQLGHAFEQSEISDLPRHRTFDQNGGRSHEGTSAKNLETE